MITAARDTARGYLRLGRTVARGWRRRSVTAKRHLLLLTWLFPPRSGSGVYRPAALVRYATRRGWQVSVLCETGPAQVDDAGRHLLEYVGSSARILPVSPSTLRPSYRAFPSVDGGFLNALAITDVAEREFAREPPGVILASGPPFHSFVAARYIARALGVPYLLDYRDEWTECPFSFVAPGNADLYYERACLREAKRVVFTTESHLHHQLRTFPFVEPSRCLVVPNGWEPADAAVTGDVPRVGRAGLHIAFVGALSDYALSGRLEFLATLAAVLEHRPGLEARLRLSFVGRRSGAADRSLRTFRYQGLLEVVDEVPRPQAMAIMRQADVLLLINDAAMARYRPGKLYDYLAAETPILVYGTGGEIGRVVQQYDAGCVVPAGDVEALEKALGTLPGLRGQSARRGIRDWLSRHTRERLAGRMIDLLEEIVARPI
jgi:glycosyltransferase involved in cell wall biosynthesis